jgi:predicted phosphodiesterase
MRPETRAAPSASLALRPLLLGLAAAVALLAGCGAARAADGPVAAGDLIAGPYVNSASVTSAKVLWLARPGVQARCEVSAEPASAGQQPKVEIKSAPLPGRLEVLYTATLAGLQPGLSYRYRVVCGAARADGSFQTPPPKGSQTPVKFVVYSDPHSQPERHRAVAEAVMKELPLAFLEVTGDLTDDGTLPELEEGFFDSARDLLRRTALWTARGNHEKEGLLYRALFDLPNNELYYSFDVGNIHWVVLDPYEEGGLRQRRGKQLDDMLAWLDQDLAGARAEWLIVAYHTPTINVGGHGSLWGYERLLPILLKHGVDLIISGHSHLYERIRPIGLEGQKPLIQIVSGGSGGETYPIAPSPVLAASYSGLHYCLFTVKGNRLEMTAKTPDGRALDTLVLVKSDGKFQSEVMAAALTPEQAMPLVKVFKLARVEFQAVPKAGQPAAALVPGDSFPKGWRVEIAKAQDCPWEVQPASFEAAGATLKLMVTPPQGTKLAATLWMGTFDPELRLRVRLARGSEN